MQPSTSVVPPGLQRLLATLLVGTLGVIGGLFLIFGFGTILAFAAAVVSGLSVLCFLVAVVRQRPRVVIAPEGFTLLKLFGEESHRWEDLDGPFAVIKIGWSKLVVYNLSASYKARVGKKPTSLFSSYDAAISGAFQLSAEQLAELLNTHQQQNRPAAAGEPVDPRL